MTIRETGKERKTLVQCLQHFSHVFFFLRVSFSFFKFVFVLLSFGCAKSPLLRVGFPWLW